MESDTFGMGALVQWMPMSLQQKLLAYCTNLEKLEADVVAGREAPAVGRGTFAKAALVEWAPISLQEKLRAYSTN